MTTRIAVVSGGLSVPSSTRNLADQLAAEIRRQLGEDGRDAAVETIELRPLAHDLADHLLTGFGSPALDAAIETVASADALVAVTPIFAASYSGLFKTFFDVLEPELLAGKPVLMAATAGTARHSLVLEHALRPLFSYLKATPVPTGVFAATEDFGDVNARLAERVERATAELVALLGGTGPRATRRLRAVAEEYDDPTPFADVLAALNSSDPGGPFG